MDLQNIESSYIADLNATNVNTVQSSLLTDESVNEFHILSFIQESIALKQLLREPLDGRNLTESLKYLVDGTLLKLTTVNIDIYEAILSTDAAANEVYILLWLQHSIILEQLIW